MYAELGTRWVLLRVFATLKVAPWCQELAMHSSHDHWHGSKGVTQGHEPLMHELSTMATVLQRSHDWQQGKCNN